MIRAWSIDDVRAAEAAAMATLPEGELMARAAEGLAEVAAARLAERDGHAVAVLVGPGDNGGDALFAAALLAGRGSLVAAVLLPEGGARAVHAAGLAAATEAGVTVLLAARPEDEEACVTAVSEADVVLDGITGIGGRPGLRDRARELVDLVDDGAWVVAVDVASGLDPEGLLPSPSHVWADETVTFGAPKPAHLLPAGEAASGRLTVVDIGVAFADRVPAVERITRDEAGRLWPVPGPTDDKYSRGVLGVVAGGEAYAGAAVLTVTAAVEAGVGMVRYVGTATPTSLVRVAVPEAVHGEGRVQAWVVGPGLDLGADGPDAEAQVAVARRALGSDLPVLLDAGALDLVDGPRDAPTLLTPHAGELARVLGRLEGREIARADVEAEPLAYARRLAERTGATVLLKGSTTLVVDPSGGVPVRSQADAPAWLATAGAGDVLAGVVGTLLAAGLPPRDAGSLGALVHGVAAEAASAGGPLRARAVAAAVPHAVRSLLARAR